jgi:hypothetical protein
MASLRIRLSSSDSASISLRRRFSISNSRKRLASSDFMPPNCFFQRIQVDSLTSNFCKNSPKVLPATNMASPSCNSFTICSGLRLRRFVIRVSCDHHWSIDSHHSWIRIWGADQLDSGRPEQQRRKSRCQRALTPHLTTKAIEM